MQTPNQPEQLAKEKAVSKGVSLTPSLWQLARHIGVGTASRGIQIALRHYAATKEVKEIIE